MSLTVTSVLTPFEPLTAFQYRAAIVVAVFSLLSVLAFVFITFWTIQDTAILFLNHDNRTSRPLDIMFFRTQIGHYIVCLILSNLFISIAGLINFRWLVFSALSQGSMCSAQAVLMQIGLWGTCWFTAAHSVHTLISLVFHLSNAHWHGVVIISVGWTVAFVAALVPMENSNIYGPNGISCSIVQSYATGVFFLRASPIILGAFVSIAVYSIRLVVLYGQNMNNQQTLQGPNSTTLRGDEVEEYNRFISVIIWTILLFPLAFLLLLCPLCIVCIIAYTRQTAPFSLRIFADVCVSMLGLINVGLLFNVFRVMRSLSHAARAAAETVLTFGHDASHESPKVSQIDFHSQRAILQYEISGRTASNNSSNSSWSSVDWNTVLISAEKTLHNIEKDKVVHRRLHIIPPAEFGRQFDHEHGVTPHDTTRGGQFVVIESPLHAVRLGPCPPHSFGPTRHEPCVQDKKHSFRRMESTGTFGKVRDESSIKSSSFASESSEKPLPILPLGAMDESVPSPIVSAGITPKPDAKSPTSIIPVSPDKSRHLSESSYASTTDTGSDYTGEVAYGHRVLLHSQLPQPKDDEEDRDTVGTLPVLLRNSTWHRRMTTVTVWSQESGDIMLESPVEEYQVAYWHMIEDLLDPPVVVSEAQAGVDVEQTGNLTHRIQPFHTGPKHLAQFPYSAPRVKSTLTTFAVKDDVV